MVEVHDEKGKGKVPVSHFMVIRGGSMLDLHGWLDSRGKHRSRSRLLREVGVVRTEITAARKKQLEWKTTLTCRVPRVALVLFRGHARFVELTEGACVSAPFLQLGQGEEGKVGRKGEENEPV
jgi:hypothetical protein